MTQISFGEWCKVNNHQDFIDLWDYNLNNKRQILGIDIPFSIQNYLNGKILKPGMVKQELVK